MVTGTGTGKEAVPGLSPAEMIWWTK